MNFSSRIRSRRFAYVEEKKSWVKKEELRENLSALRVSGARAFGLAVGTSRISLEYCIGAPV